MAESKDIKEILVEALTNKENKRHQDIIAIIFSLIPKNKVNDCFVFICQGAAKTEISPTIAKFVLDQLLREDDVESVTDDGDIERLKTAGDIIKSVNMPYVMKKYPSMITDIAFKLFKEFTERYADSSQFCALVAKMLDGIDNNTIQKIYDECVKKKYIEEEQEENPTNITQNDNTQSTSDNGENSQDNSEITEQ